MANEKELTDIFKKNLAELRRDISSFEEVYLDFDPQGYSIDMARNNFPGIIQYIRRKIQELRQIGVSEHRINEAINRILERVRSEVLRILRNIKLSETERQISQHLDQIDSSLNFSYDERKNQVQTRQMWAHEIKALEELNVAEEDLVEANERILKILDRLVQAAEKLE